ncbi:hypothetical protein COLO4_29250 [Corchorus olitorius]|uniref:Uncharacterized protein n=1 Tax=Corchorus olitorius TaxID=93759 RepID=A0A1R3HFQ3_9ROSI|nr:hypothetical protein COLO4_29250 [Corchorus olitorius]
MKKRESKWRQEVTGILVIFELSESLCESACKTEYALHLSLSAGGKCCCTCGVFELQFLFGFFVCLQAWGTDSVFTWAKLSYLALSFQTFALDSMLLLLLAKL